MVSCASCGCSLQQKRKDSSVTFHKFPKDQKRKAAWIQFVNKPEFSPKPSSVLCSYHFAENYFDRTSKIAVKLLPNAIPTIEVERLKYVRTYNPIVTRPSECVVNTMTHSANSLSNAGPSSVPEPLSTAVPSYMPKLSVREQTPPPLTDIPSVELEETPRKRILKRKISELQQLNVLKGRKIRALQKSNNKLKKKISSLKSLMTELKKKNLLSCEHEDIMIQHFGKKNKEIIGRLLKKSLRKQLEGMDNDNSIGDQNKIKPRDSPRLLNFQSDRKRSFNQPPRSARVKKSKLQNNGEALASNSTSFEVDCNDPQLVRHSFDDMQIQSNVEPILQACDPMKKFCGNSSQECVDLRTNAEDDEYSNTTENENLDSIDCRSEENEYSQSIPPTSSPASYQPKSPSFQLTVRRRKHPVELREAEKEMNEVVSRDEMEDECELYGRLLAKKLRKIPEWERQLIMHEIDGMLINAMHRFGGSNSAPPPLVHNNRQSSHSTSFLSSQDQTCQRHTEDAEVDSKADIITIQEHKIRL